MTERVPVLLVNGTVGVGKTTIVGEINAILWHAKVPHAALDLDAVRWGYPETSPFNADLMFENVAAIWQNWSAHGATRFVLGGVVTTASDIERYRVAIPNADITLCRLVAPHEVRIERLRRRMRPGDHLDWHLARTGELHDILERARLEDFVVENGDRAVGEVAVEVLTKAGWV